MRPRTSTAVVALSALIALVPPCLAQDESSQEQPVQSQSEATEEESLPLLGRSAPTGAAQPHSLAEVARNVKLQQPQNEEGIVISNSNLRELGDQGWISVTGSASAPLLGDAPQSSDERNDWETGYQEQAETIKRLEARLQDFDQAMQQVPDTYRQGRGAHSYAGGRQPEIQIQRDQLEAQLELERSKLDRMRQQGRRLGVNRDFYDQADASEQQ